MVKKQNKRYEIEIFDAAANAQDYEISVGPLYSYIHKLIGRKIGTLEGKMLEAGCGTGAFGKNLLKHSKKLRIIGVDISPKMIKRANNQTRNYSALVGDLEKESLFKARSFDYIYCPFVLHHFPDPEKVFRNLKLWVKPGGFIIIVEPNSLNIISRLSNIMRRIVEAIFGKQYLVDHSLASPNEIDHPVSVYTNALRRHNFGLIFCESKYVKLQGKNMISLGGLKVIMWKIIHYLIPKSPFSHSVVLIIAQSNQ